MELCNSRGLAMFLPCGVCHNYIEPDFMINHQLRKHLHLPGLPNPPPLYPQPQDPIYHPGEKLERLQAIRWMKPAEHPTWALRQGAKPRARPILYVQGMDLADLRPPVKTVLRAEARKPPLGRGSSRGQGRGGRGSSTAGRGQGMRLGGEVNALRRGLERLTCRVDRLGERQVFYQRQEGPVPIPAGAESDDSERDDLAWGVSKGNCDFCTEAQCRGIPKKCPGCKGGAWSYIPPTMTSKGTLTCYNTHCLYWQGGGRVYSFHPQLTANATA